MARNREWAWHHAGGADAGFLAIGIELVVKTRLASGGGAGAEIELKHTKLRMGIKQALLISMLQRPEGVTMHEIVSATGSLGPATDGDELSGEVLSINTQPCLLRGLRGHGATSFDAQLRGGRAFDMICQIEIGILGQKRGR